MSAEHYLTRHILRQLRTDGDETVEIGGLAWQQPKNVLESKGVNSLTANLYCERHNNNLTKLDSEAGRLFQTLNAIDKTPAHVPSERVFSGALLERWALKVAIGLSASRNVRGFVEEKWKGYLFDDRPWPAGCGLYVWTEPRVVAGVHLMVKTHLDPTGKIAVVDIHMPIATFVLTLVPVREVARIFRHPRELAFDIPEGRRRVLLSWEEPSIHSITYTHAGRGGQSELYRGWYARGGGAGGERLVPLLRESE